MKIDKSDAEKILDALELNRNITRNELALKIYEETDYSYDIDRDLLKQHETKVIEAVLEMVEEEMELLQTEIDDKDYVSETKAMAYNEAKNRLKEIKQNLKQIIDE